MKITGTVQDWEEWTNLKFFQSGRYVVNGALKPIRVNIDKDIGEYVEPNIWVVHSL